MGVTDILNCTAMEKYSSGSLTFSKMEDVMFLILPWQFPTIKDKQLPHFQQSWMLRRALMWVNKSSSSKAYIMDISYKYAFCIYDI